MDAFLVGIGSAAWLGVLTSISPCPLATNIAAISYVGRDMGKARMLLLSGVLYTLGRMLAYTALGALAVGSILSIPGASTWLQRNINLLVGPLLVLVGMILLELISMPGLASNGVTVLRDRVQNLGLTGSVLLGVLFALSFCPVSAALFFGSLVPLAIAERSPLLLPAIYGIGTGVPVMGFALIMATGTKALSSAFRRVSGIEKWLRFVTGSIILLIGIYLTLQQVFGVIG